MSKTFAVIGTGWRAKFFLRIAASKDNDFSVTGVLCRSKEKEDIFHEEFGVFTTQSEQDICDAKPDFIVVSVSKPDVYKVSKHWRELGFTVICETPVGITEEDFKDVLEMDGKPLLVAEQYQYYPTYKKMIEIVKSGKLGEINAVDVALAHEYHGASLIRHFLDVSYDTPYEIMVRKYELPVTKTGDRYYIYEDGEIIHRNRTKAFIEFEGGKIATYDFDSEQYHSLIRHNTVKIRGTRGEIIDEKMWCLDENNVGQEEVLFEDIQSVRDGAVDGMLSQDETAISELLENTYLVSKACDDLEYPNRDAIMAWAKDNLMNAIADARFMNALNE